MIIWRHHRTVVRNKWDNEIKHLAWCWEHNEGLVNINYFNLKRLLKGKINAKNIIVKYCFISLYFSLGRKIIFKEIVIEYIDRFSWKVTLFIKTKEWRCIKFSFYVNIRQWKLPQTVSLQSQSGKIVNAQLWELWKGWTFLFPRKLTKLPKSIKCSQRPLFPRADWTYFQVLPSGWCQTNAYNVTTAGSQSEYSCFVLFCFLILLCFPVWWENSDQIWSHWEFLKLSTIPGITSRMTPRTCCLILGPLAFNPLYQYSWHVGIKHAQWGSGRARSWLKALSVTLWSTLSDSLCTGVFYNV